MSTLYDTAIPAVRQAVTHDAVEFWSRIGYDPNFPKLRGFASDEERAIVREEVSDEAVSYYYDGELAFPRKSFELVVREQNINNATDFNSSATKNAFIAGVITLYRHVLDGRAVFSDETENLLLRDTFLFSKKEEIEGMSAQIAKIVPALVPEAAQKATVDSYASKLGLYARELGNVSGLDLQPTRVVRPTVEAEPTPAPPLPPRPSPEPDVIAALKEKLENAEAQRDELATLIDDLVGPLKTFIGVLERSGKFKSSTASLKATVNVVITEKEGILAE